MILLNISTCLWKTAGAIQSHDETICELKNYIIALVYWIDDKIWGEWVSCSVMSDTLRPCGLKPARLLCPWNVDIPFSRGSSWPRDQTQVSWMVGRFFLIWATREAKTPMLGKTEDERRVWQRTRWLDGITKSMDVNLGELWEMLKDREAVHTAVHGVTRSLTGLSSWTTTVSLINNNKKTCQQECYKKELPLQRWCHPPLCNL